MFIHEYVFALKVEGKFVFDKVWKDLFKKRILDNKYIHYFLGDILSQYSDLQQGKGHSADVKKKKLLVDMVDCYDKLETDR
jgi:hypothetical protein